MFTYVYVFIRSVPSRALARSSCMKSYRWSSGGRVGSKVQNETPINEWRQCACLIRQELEEFLCSVLFLFLYRIYLLHNI